MPYRYNATRHGIASQNTSVTFLEHKKKGKLYLLALSNECSDFILE
jgi:hypothetical protein